MRIDPSGIGQTPIAPATPTVRRGEGFEDLLRGSLGEVNSLQANAEDMIARVAAGEDIDPAIVANAVNKADLAFRTMIQIRTKLVDAFNELRQLQL